MAPEDLEPFPRATVRSRARREPVLPPEEPLSYLPHRLQHLHSSDRGTLTNLLTSHNGYTLSTGVLSAENASGIASIRSLTGRAHAGGLHHATTNVARAPLCCATSTSCTIISANPSVSARTKKRRRSRKPGASHARPHRRHPFRLLRAFTSSSREPMPIFV